MPPDSYSDSAGPGRSISDLGTGAAFASFRPLSDSDRQAIGAIIESRYRIKLAQDQAREDLKALAENLGMKSSELNRVITLAMNERERGNVLMHEKALIGVAEQVVFTAALKASNARSE